MMQHGVADSSDDFIVNTKDKAPAFVVAEAGYDVWLPNNRGNMYSRKHKNLDSDKDLQYW
jgi:pimeloyl-ACP methyl ester carboxylesterase